VLSLAIGLPTVAGCKSKSSTKSKGESKGPEVSPDPPVNAEPKPLPVGDPLELKSIIETPRKADNRSTEIMGMAVRGDNVYYCTHITGMHVARLVDGVVQHESAPRLKKFHKIRPRCEHVAATDKWLFVSSRGEEVQPTPFLSVVDLTAKPPREVALLEGDADHSFEGIAARGDIVYAALHGSGVGVYQVEGKKLKEIRIVSGLQHALELELVGDLIYVADGTGGLSVLDLADPLNPKLVATLALEGIAQNVHVEGPMAYVALRFGGVGVVDVADPKNPKLVTTIDTDGTTMATATIGGHLLALNWSTVRIYDLADPKQPAFVGTEVLPLPEWTKYRFERNLSITTTKDYILIGGWGRGYVYKLNPGVRGPNLSISEYSVEMGRVAAGQTRTESINIVNDGAAPLHVSASAKAPFSTDAGSQTLEPGKSASIAVSFKPANDEVVTSELVLKSDDPDLPEARIPLRGNLEVIRPGDPFPELEMEAVEDGEPMTIPEEGAVTLLAYFATF
jgi:hypothetical protein